jgi:predicted DNA binding CopG/RHH family protein
MKKQAKSKTEERQSSQTVPVYEKEAAEAEWWHENRDSHGKQLLDGVRNGDAQVLTRDKLLARVAASRKAAAPVVSLRIPEADLALARKQAERKGLPYQTYIKSLLHETLAAREKRKLGH